MQKARQPCREWLIVSSSHREGAEVDGDELLGCSRLGHSSDLEAGAYLCEVIPACRAVATIRGGAFSVNKLLIVNSTYQSSTGVHSV